MQDELKELLPVLAAAGFRPPFDSDSRDDQSIAYHEAGHVIAGLWLGRTLNWVSIEPGEEGADFEALPGGASPRDDASKLVRTGLGGPIAEQQRFGLSWGFLGDIRQIRLDIVPLLDVKNEVDMLRELSEAVQKAMKRNRSSLDALAKALIREKRLSGEEVKKLVTIE
jgi:ATP-dependent Zn protease